MTAPIRLDIPAPLGVRIDPSRSGRTTWITSTFKKNGNTKATTAATNKNDNANGTNAIAAAFAIADRIPYGRRS